MKRFTIRIYIYFISGVLIASFFSVLILSIDYKKNIHSNLEKSLIRGTIAAQNIIDPYNHKLLSVNSSGRETGFYKETLAKLEQVREISNFAYIYTLVRNEEGKFFFIFDTADYKVNEGEKISYYRIYDNMPPEVSRAYGDRRATITENYYQDEWGVFKSAFHPVTDKKGNVEFIIGVDYDASYIASLNRKVAWSLVIAISAAFPFIIVLIVLLKKDTVAHVDKLTGEILVREKENLQLKNYLSNIIESMPAVLVSTDSTGKVIEWNMAAEKSTGIARDEAFGRNIIEVIPCFEKYYPALGEVKDSKVPKEYRREKVQWHGEKFLDILIYPLIANGIEGSVIKIDDVTEAELQEQKLIQFQKMESLGILAGGIAHDFNNVLGGIMGAVSLLKLKTENLRIYEELNLNNYVRIIEDASLHGKALTSQLLAVSAKRESEKETVNISEITDKVVDICRSTFESTITIDYHSQDRSLSVTGDRGQLEQIIMNLCINGYQAMTLMNTGVASTQDKLDIKLVRYIPDEKFIQSHPSAAGDYCCISVSDSGVGIAPEKLEQIFEPFFSSKSENGTGLGLFIVTTIVDRHNGFIEVESRQGEGTTFSVYLPLTESDHDRLEPEHGGKCLESGSGLLIVADDQPLMRNTIAMMLEQCGFEVLQVSDGESAIALFEDNIDRVKGVLADLVMPGISGIEVAAKIKKRKSQVKTVLVTGYPDRFFGIESTDSVDVCLEKPFTVDNISEALLKAGLFE